MARFEQAMNQTRDVVFMTDLEGVITYVNPAFEALYGYKAEEVIGRNPRVLKSGVQSPEAYEKFWGTISSGKSFKGEFVNKTKDGRLVDVEVTVDPVSDARDRATGYHAIQRDITARKQADKALLESEAKFRALTETSASGIFIYQGDKFRHVNQMAQTITGYSREEFLTMNFWDIVHPDFRELVRQRGLARQRGEQLPPRYEFKIITKTGEERWLDFTAGVIQFEGRPAGLGTAFDITERKRAEGALRMSEERFRTLYENSTVGLYRTTPDGRILLANPTLVRMLGFSSFDELSTRSLEQGYEPGYSRSGFLKRIEREGEIKGLEAGWRRRDGAVVYVRESARAIRDSQGKTLYYDGTVEDITERKRAEEASRASEERYRELAEAAHDMIFILNRDMVFEYCNQFAAQQFRRSPEQLIGVKFTDLFPPQVHSRQIGNVQRVFDSGMPLYIEAPTGFTEGMLWQETWLIPLKDKSGTPRRVMGVARDITKRRQAEEALDKERALLRMLIESIPDEICLKDRDHRFLIANRAVVKAMGATSESQLIGKSDLDLVDPALAQEHLLEEEVILRTGQPLVNVEREKVHPETGEVEKCMLTTKVAAKDASGNTMGLLVINRYITERKKAEEALRESEERYRNVIESVRDIIFTASPSGILTTLNPAFERITGWNSEEWIGKSFTDLLHPEDLPAMKEHFSRLVEGKNVRVVAVRIRMQSGTFAFLEIKATPKAEDGSVVGVFGVARDVTERKLLEDQLRQAQKMECIGTLAGGIAHDFNNILGIILGHSSLLEHVKGEDRRVADSLASVNKAVQRGASLVRQILTFARKAETKLELVNINTVVKELSKMLQGTFPKTVTLNLKLDSAVPLVFMDQSQLYQIVLNLSVNGRDAMSGNGTLTVSTDVVDGAALAGRFPGSAKGHYVHLSVSDTGSGMDAATMTRIFEPFFTTKGEGSGTGLGLAVVYGVVKAHQGHIDVESALGHGTTFHLYFPVPDGIIPPQSDGAGREKRDVGGTETILVVEDEELIRELIISVLQSHGYNVLAAQDGEEAVKLYADHMREIALVLSDMGLPRLDGWKAARKILKMNPSVRILLASGYIGPNQKSEILASDVRGVIQKPYSPTEILRAVREALDA